MTKTRDLIWVHKFEQVQIFREIFGHSVIPQRYHRNPSLGSWVTKQRFFSKNMCLNIGRNILLQKLEFTYISAKNFYFFALWNKHYLELCYYKKIYGHCNVPGNYSENISLGIWVKNQRQLLKKNKLDNYKVKLLFKIGFEWGRRNKILRISWEKRFYELFCHFKKYGNINIPQRNGSLGKWVQNQRDFLKKYFDKNKKLKLLRNIDFNTRTRKNDKTINFYKGFEILKIQKFLCLDQEF